MESLAAIAASPPELRADRVAAAVEAWFGLAGDLAPLVSERDQNFRLSLADGRCFVVKVTGLQEDALTSDFQLGALLHLEHAAVTAPRVVRTLDGATHAYIDSDMGRHRLRVVTWVDGRTLLDAGVDETRAARFGEALGRLDDALRGFSHPGENPLLLWDLQRAGELRGLVTGIDDDELRTRVVNVIDDVASNIEPATGTLPAQVIHGDANPENVLVSEAGIGFIDFGDMVRAPRIYDVAIAAAYLRSTAGDPLVFVRPFVAAYHAVTALDEAELRLLFDLIRARLATTITLLYWRLGERAPGDEYRQKSLAVERTASRFLAALDGLGRDEFSRQINGLL